MEESYAERLEEAKGKSVLQLLFRAARVCNERGLARVRERVGEVGIREVHLRMFAHIDLEGTRLTTLAGRLGVSKQAASQWVDELIAIDFLEKVPDPSDGRARLIQFSADGRKGLLEGLGVLMEMEREFASVVGQGELDALHQVLVKLLAHVEPR